jgi:rhomboid family GlyGly-CTERM serine protease
VPAERLGLALLALLVAAANLLPGETVEWRREAIMRGELWRLWSGQLCHWSSAHLAGNLAAMAAVGVIAGRPVRRWLAALPLAAPLLSLFLLVAAPALESYRGLSGLVGVLVVGAVLTGGGPGRLLGLAYLGKLAFDIATGGGSALLPAGIAVTWQAHLGGLLIGTALAVAFRRLDAGRH